MSDFTNRCTSTLEANGDEASKVEEYDNALAVYSIALSLSPSTLRTLLVKWARLILVRGSANKALDVAAKVPSHHVPLMGVDFPSLQFQIPKLLVYQAVCDVLEHEGRLTEAIQCFQKLQNDFIEDTSTYTAWKVGEWVQGSVSRGVPNILDRLSTSLYEEAGKFERYSDGLSKIRRGHQTLFRVVGARSLECQQCPL